MLKLIAAKQQQPAAAAGEQQQAKDVLMVSKENRNTNFESEKIVKYRLKGEMK